MTDRSELRRLANEVAAGVSTNDTRREAPTSRRQALRDLANQVGSDQAALVRSGSPEREEVTFRDIDNFVRSMAEGLTFGFADEIAAGLDTVTGRGPGMDFQSNLDFQRRAQEDIPTGQRIAGNIAGGFLIPGGTGALARLTRGVPGVAPVTGALATATRPTRSVRGTAAQGAGFGVLSGLGTSEGDAGQMLQDALIGGGTGAGVGLGLSALSRAISPQVSDDVTALQTRGVTPTGGQISGRAASEIEQRASGTLPIMGSAISAGRRRALADFNRAAADEALGPVNIKIPRSVDAGQDMIGFAQKQVDELYDDLLGSIPRVRGDQQLRDDFANVLEQTQFLDERGQNEVRKQLERVASRLANEQQQSGAVSASVAKDIAIQLRNRVRQLRQSTSQFERDIAEPLGSLRDAFTDLIERNAPENVGARLRDIDFAYAGLRNLENAAVRAASNDGVFTPGQLLLAIRQNEIGRRRFARGDALMQQLAQQGQRVLGDTVPDSGTAGRIFQGASLPAAIIADPVTGLSAAGALTVGAAPFTPFGQRVTAAALTGRQGPVPRALSRIPPALTPGLVAGQSVRE